VNVVVPFEEKIIQIVELHGAFGARMLMAFFVVITLNINAFLNQLAIVKNVGSYGLSKRDENISDGEERTRHHHRF
jgi:hypothetical protein